MECLPTNAGSLLLLEMQHFMLFNQYQGQLTTTNHLEEFFPFGSPTMMQNATRAMRVHVTAIISQY
jgi:hypothetical protein